jgi:hypothetical protein
MAAGDLRGEECIVIMVQYGATNAVGDVVHLEADGKWDGVVATDLGKFGVALDAGVDTEYGRVCIWGRCEVTATAAAIAKGSYVVAGSTGRVAQVGTLDATSVLGLLVGTAMEAFQSSGTGTIWVGLVG